MYARQALLASEAAEMNAHTHTYIQTSIHSHAHVYTSYTHSCTCARPELRTSEAAKMCVCARMYVHTCVHRNTYMYIYMYTCIRVYITHTYLHVCPPRTTHKRGSSRQQHSTTKSRGQHLRENHCPCHICISLYPHLYVLSSEIRPCEYVYSSISLCMYLCTSTSACM